MSANQWNALRDEIGAWANKNFDQRVGVLSVVALRCTDDHYGQYELSLKSGEKLQTENFRDNDSLPLRQPSQNPTLGIFEEIGEYFTVRSDMGCCPRSWTETQWIESLDALADVMVFMGNLCHAEQLDFDKIVTSRELEGDYDGSMLWLLVRPLAHSILKRDQRIKTMQDRDVFVTAAEEALAGIVGWVKQEFNQLGVAAQFVGRAIPGSLFELVDMTWAKVGRRDFNKSTTGE